jgi:hypothetical protein
MQSGMPALPGHAPEGGAALAIHLIATVEDFEILRRIGIVSVKVWLLRRWRLAQGFFNALNQYRSRY